MYRGCWLVALFVCALATHADPLVLRTLPLQLEIREGVVIALAHRGTMDEYRFETPPPFTGIRHLQEGDLWNATAQAEGRLTSAEATSILRWQREGRHYTLTTRWRALPDGEIVVMQRAEGARPGLVGMQWGIVVPDDWELLVPAHGGLRFSRESDYHPRQFHYPMEWEAQFVLIQGKRGGILIHAEDNAQRFKRLFLQRRQGQFWVGFETWCTAPFERVQRAESVRWRIRPYVGSWLHGVALYRQWAVRAFGLAELRRLQPAWVREIQTVFIDNLDDMEKIQALAKRVNPRQTLIYVADWRRDDYDRNYPDYTPAEGFAEKMERVRRWGFRIMLHVNYFGCTPENPEYERLKQYHFRDPFTRQPLYWEWPADPPIKFAYINPAAKAWRTLFVQRMVELCRQLKPDALHLDQTLCIYNDANGLIDGMNAMQGNIALHRELREALPDVALSGEGLNEISFRYEEFAQRHVWGLDHVRQSWDATLVRMAHPVSSALLSPHTRLYGYLGMCSPRMWHYYTAWRTAYDRMGVLPTFAWVDREVVTQPDAALQTLWKETRWFQQHQPVPDFTPSRWGQDTLFVYRTREGRVARFRRDASGVCLEAQGNGGWQTVSRRVEGVSRARVKGSVPYWKAYSEGMLFGLNPDTVYPWTAQPPPRDVTHLSDLGAETVLTAAAVREGEWAWFHLEPLARNLPLWREGDGVTYGVAAPSGEGKRGAGYLVEVDAETGAQAVPLGEGVFMHPPFRRYRGGSTWLEYRLTLPAGVRAEFRTRVGFYSPWAAERSTGMTFMVTAGAGGEQLSRSEHVRGNEPREMVLDLTPLRGRQVTIRLETSPGADGSPDYDHGLWMRPRVVLLPVREHEVEVSSPQEPVQAWWNAQAVSWRPRGEGRYRLTLPPASGTLVMLFRSPQPVALPLSLSQVPFHSALMGTDGVMHEQSGYLGSAVASGTCGRVTKESLSAHPPPNGKNVLSFVLTLPARETTLRGFAGIGDGAEGKTNGVRFSVEVNGKELWSQEVQAGTGWQPFSVSLSEWAGQTVLLRLVTDSLGDFSWDWALWGEVRIE